MFHTVTASLSLLNPVFSIQCDGAQDISIFIQAIWLPMQANFLKYMLWYSVQFNFNVSSGGLSPHSMGHYFKSSVAESGSFFL